MADWKQLLKPRSLADYVRIGPILIWRWLWFFLLALLFLWVILWAGPPLLAKWREGTSQPAGAAVDADHAPLLRWNDPALEGKTGLVRIMDDAGVVRYTGEIKVGMCTGQGTVYDREGIPVYMGALADNQYEGEGKLLAPDGTVLYQGGFTKNEPQGSGRREDPETGIVSEGNFLEGSFTGQGIQSLNGRVLREGSFRDGLLSGVGKEYAPDGSLLREGNFEGGLLSGNGTEQIYEEEAILTALEPLLILSGKTSSELVGKDGMLSLDELFKKGQDGTSQAGGSTGQTGSGGQTGASGGAGGTENQSGASGTGQGNTGNSQSGTASAGSPVSEGSGGKGSSSSQAGGSTGQTGSGGASSGLTDGGKGTGSSTPVIEINQRGTAAQNSLRLEGFFEKGKLEGAGRAFVNGVALYEGAFHDGNYQGDGTLRDLGTGRTRYEGNFQQGLPAGKGQLYDQYGQHYYSGPIYRGQIDALSYLGTSLSQVESAFQTHYRIYSCKDQTAFVYPQQGIAFLTDSPVKLLDPSASSEEESGETEFPSEPAPESEEGEAGEEELLESQELWEQTRTKEIVISGLLLVREDSPGLPASEEYRLAEDEVFGQADCFGMELLGEEPQGYQRLQSSQFVTLFALEKEGEPPLVLRERAVKGELLVRRCTMKKGRYYLVCRNSP